MAASRTTQIRSAILSLCFSVCHLSASLCYLDKAGSPPTDPAYIVLPLGQGTVLDSLSSVCAQTDYQLKKQRFPTYISHPLPVTLTPGVKAMDMRSNPDRREAGYGQNSLLPK